MITRENSLDKLALCLTLNLALNFTSIKFIDTQQSWRRILFIHHFVLKTLHRLSIISLRWLPRGRWTTCRDISECLSSHPFQRRPIWCLCHRWQQPGPRSSWRCTVRGWYGWCHFLYHPPTAGYFWRCACCLGDRLWPLPRGPSSDGWPAPSSLLPRRGSAQASCQATPLSHGYVVFLWASRSLWDYRPWRWACCRWQLHLLCLASAQTRHWWIHSQQRNQ